jgi:hypothetical protein
MPGKETLPEGETLRLNEWGESLGWLLAGFAFLLGVFLLLVGPSPHGNLGGPLRPVLGLVWMAFGAMIAGGVRSGLIVEESGIIVQGPLRRKHWAWYEVEAFEIKQAFYRQALRIMLVDGKQVSTPGFSGKSEKERRLVDERVAELNRRAAYARST